MNNKLVTAVLCLGSHICNHICNRAARTRANDLYLCRELGHGQMGLPGTMQSGHPINQMMVMVERTAWICGENMTSLMMQIVHWHSLTSARNKTK
jgi:hypothetical protein